MFDRQSVQEIHKVVKSPNRKLRTGVMIVDDEPKALHYGKLALQNNLGLTDILTAGNASDALALMEQHADHIGVMIIDVRMPGYDGHWLCKQIKKAYPETVCVISTSYPKERLDPNADQVCFKPWDMKTLCRYVNMSLLRVA